MLPSEMLASTVTLRSGAVVKNRFLKSAMSEVLGTADNRPTAGLSRLYATWADGGCGLLVTGNVMIDRRALGEPRNVVFEDESDLERLQEWARAGTRGDAHLWVQLNHPGKQSPKTLSRDPVAPSAIPLGRGLEKVFNKPSALTEDQIEDIIDRFARAAQIAKKAGFTGVQIHGAHGYLVSQFLSPRHNRRTDRFGGSAENRMRFVLEVYDAIRRGVGDSFPVGIKLNSADFQRGGFSNEESLAVMKALDERGIDLIEVSGGNYESPAMVGVRQSTKDREAYFLEFAEEARREIGAALVVTGGFRTAAGMAAAVKKNATDLVGLARPMAVVPDIPSRILAGENFESGIKRLSTGIKAIDRVAPLEITWYEQQIALMARGKQPNPKLHPGISLIRTALSAGVQALGRRRA